MEQVEPIAAESSTLFGGPYNRAPRAADDTVCAEPPQSSPITLEERLARLESIFNVAPAGLCCLDLNYRYITVNQCFARMYGLPLENFIGRTVSEALPAVASQIIAHLDHSLAIQDLVEVEITVEQPSLLGEGHPPRQMVYLRSSQPMRDASGGIVGFSVALVDITERECAEAALRESEENYRYTVDLNPHVPWTAAPDGTILHVSPRYVTLTGLTTDQAREEGWYEGVFPEDRDEAVRAWTTAYTTGTPYDHSYRLCGVDNSWRWVRARAFPRYAPTGEIVRWYGNLEDIHERKLLDDALKLKTAHLEEATRQLTDRTREDHLTGIANRRHFDDALMQEAARARRSGLPLALIMIDVDHFKRFNDTYGHPAGDECLRSVAKALGVVLRRQGDLAARYGGEEFVVLLPDTPLEGALAVAQLALEAVRALAIPHIGSSSGTLTISAGVALFDADRHSAISAYGHGSDLVQSADVALYAAKSKGRDCIVHAANFVVAPTPALLCSK